MLGEVPTDYIEKMRTGCYVHKTVYTFQLKTDIFIIHASFSIDR
jgi:hypothetical protein